MFTNDGATGSLEQWLPMYRRRHGADLRLYCFPYAGGSAASFGDWLDRLPIDVEVRPVQLPGRWSRLSEPPATRLDQVVDAVGPLIASLADRPYAMFGHSMGALMAFETARFMRRCGAPPPLGLYVSGRRAPHLPVDGLPPDDLSDAEFLDTIRRFNGTPDEVLANKELMALFLPTLRADLATCRNYRHRLEPPLAVPIFVFGGTEDEESAPGHLEAWQQHTTAGCRVMRFPGGHFFLHTHCAALVHAIWASLHHQYTGARLPQPRR